MQANNHTFPKTVMLNVTIKASKSETSRGPGGVSAPFVSLTPVPESVRDRRHDKVWLLISGGHKEFGKTKFFLPAGQSVLTSALFKSEIFWY